MEQFFVIVAVIVFWVVRGLAGSQRRVPGQDPYDGESMDPGRIDISGAARQKTLESQQRAIEALQRWEEKQGLSPGKADSEPPPVSSRVAATSRTRVGRPATISSRTTAARQRQEAFADVAGMLEPDQSRARTSGGRHRFDVKAPEARVPSQPAPSEAKSSVERRPSDAALSRASARADQAAHDEDAAQKRAAAGKDEKTAPLSTLARLESLPLAARAIVYSEILGRPRSLS